MLISRDWLTQYLSLSMTTQELAARLMMAGLSHESVTPVGGDEVIDLEVTSNRPDCLGHLGVAREVAVLFDLPLALPAAAPREQGPAASELTKVRIDCPELCTRYIARVIRGVTVGPSPAWLTKRLAAVGIAAINNIVDITNYVLFECGQPLHAFDFAKLAGREIIVRRARNGEPFEAINHKSYTLDGEMCVIADAQRPVALGGVMGGALTEVSSATVDVLIEAADFSPLSIRSTARKLSLHSDSSYRFERGVDPLGVDWASRRCCELIVELAGGTLASGAVEVGPPIAPRAPIKLRFAQLRRILGIEVDTNEACRIVSALGNHAIEHDASSVVVIPPSWRRDVDREIDLIEEVARIHGYEQIPEDVPVAMVPSTRGAWERVLERLRNTLAAGGFDEAMTISAEPAEWSDVFSPWSSEPPLRCATPVLRRAECLRRSLVPSLLDARRINESLSNDDIELFETAKAYWSRPGELPREEWMLALTTGRGLLAAKGALESLLAVLRIDAPLRVVDFAHPLFLPGRGVRLELGGETWGYLGDVSPAGQATFDLRGPAAVAEVLLAPVAERAQLVAKHARLSTFPAIDRDVNLVVPEATRWADLEQTVRAAAGEHLESLAYRETYRNAKDPQLGSAKKSLLFTLRFRSADGTLTSPAVDAIRDSIVRACQSQHTAELRAGSGA